MWLSKQAASRRDQEKDAQIGTVTIPGESPAARTDKELRGLVVAAPGGYVWVPGQDDEVLTLVCGTGETVVAGRRVRVPEGMQPGEIYLHTSGGGSVMMKNSGEIRFSGNVDIQGNLTVNGVPVMLAL